MTAEGTPCRVAFLTIYKKGETTGRERIERRQKREERRERTKKEGGVGGAVSFASSGGGKHRGETPASTCCARKGFHPAPAALVTEMMMHALLICWLRSQQGERREGGEASARAAGHSLPSMTTAPRTEQMILLQPPLALFRGDEEGATPTAETVQALLLLLRLPHSHSLRGVRSRRRRLGGGKQGRRSFASHKPLSLSFLSPTPPPCLPPAHRSHLADHGCRRQS